MDPNSLGTAIMQTMVSALTQTAAVVVPVDIVNSAVPTFTPEPTLSPTVTLSPAALFTVTPLVPLISVSVDTNCRTGPGKVYDRVGALMVGEVAEVRGRDPTGGYWYIPNPDRSNAFCWVWGEYATFTGNTGALPLYTPPPTPTPLPAFEADYSDLDACVGWWVEFQLTNTGGITFKSISLTIRDLETDTDVSMSADKFTDLDACLDSSSEDSLSPGETTTVSTPTFAYDPNGHQLRATITLCSATGQEGACVTEVFKFKP